MNKISFVYAAFLCLLMACNRIDDKVTPLAAPSQVKIQQVGMTSAKLTWTVESSFDKTVIERILVGEQQEYGIIAELDRDVLTYHDESLSQEGNYRYRLYTCRGTEQSAYAQISFKYSKLPHPTDFKGDLTPDGYVMTWKDNCVGEEGYIIRRRVGKSHMVDWKVLGPDVTTVTDSEVVSGEYDYQLFAFAGDERSAPASLHLDNYYEPQLLFGNVQNSWHTVHRPITVKDDGGYKCEVGVCWRSDGGKGALMTDNNYVYPSSVVTGDLAYLTIRGLEYGKTYQFRPWVRYDGKIRFFNEFSGKLMDEPAALDVKWEDITGSYDMSASIRLYRTITDVAGRTVKAWYAVADMSAGDIELRTFKTSSVMKTSDAAKAGLASGDVMVMVNGGYFEDGQSYSYVLNCGNEEAIGIKSVTGSFYGDADGTSVTRTYDITRGAFGVNERQQPSIKWLHGSMETAYDTPLPVYNSGPVLIPDARFPGARQTWDVYSAIGGGPVILDEGRLCFDYLVTKDKGNGGRYISNPEFIGDDMFGPSVRIPRTAIGHTADGKIVIMVVEGSDSGDSVGVSLDELALLMKGVGCTDALNLDGGGSSVFCVSPSATILNKPSDGAERAVLSFVALVSK